MITNAEQAKLRSVIDEVVREHIRSGDIVDVVVSHKERLEDDDLIVVDVIFDNKLNRLDPAETSELARHVWKRIVELDVPGFPSLTFIAQSDLRKAAAA
jgi:hypothetical protein